jgi:tetratricopeptide (TPR) repeat protein
LQQIKSFILKRLVPFLCCFFLFSAANAQRKNARPFYKAGMELKQTNNFAEALNSFTQAVSVDKKFDSAYVEIGNIYSAGGNNDLAVNNYKKALALNPVFTAALVGMGKIYRDAPAKLDSAAISTTINKNLDSALIYYTAAEKTDKTSKDIYYALAWICNAKKEFDRAIPYAVKSLEIDNTYKPAYGELGFSYRSTKKFAECIEQFKKNLAVSVVDVALLYSGYAYIELKDKTGATKCYEDLLKVNERMAGALKKKIDIMPAEGN